MATVSMLAVAAAAAIAPHAASPTVEKVGTRAMVSEFRGVRELSMAAAIAPGIRMLRCCQVKQSKALKAVSGVRAMASSNGGALPPSGLPIDLRGVWQWQWWRRSETWIPFLLFIIYYFNWNSV